MQSIPEQFKADALAQINSRVRDTQLMAENVLELGREIGMLNMRTGKASAEQLAGAMQKLLGASNPGEFFQLAATVMRPDMQLWTDYVAQLQDLAGKARRPSITALAPALTPLADALDSTWLKPQTSAPDVVVAPAPVVEAPAAPEETLADDTVEPLAAAQTGTTAEADAPGEDAAQAEPVAAAMAAVAAVAPIGDVAEEIVSTDKTPPATPASGSPKTVKIDVPHKTASARPVRRPATPPALKKAAAPARSAANRARKG